VKAHAFARGLKIISTTLYRYLQAFCPTGISVNFLKISTKIAFGFLSEAGSLM